MNDKPYRVQLSRKAGWRKPEKTISVARPGKWGNPYVIGQVGPYGGMALDREGAVGLFRAMLNDPEIRATASYPDDLSSLRGHNLACWCPLGEPCHADVLLELANEPPL